MSQQRALARCRVWSLLAPCSGAGEGVILFATTRKLSTSFSIASSRSISMLIVEKGVQGDQKIVPANTSACQYSHLRRLQSTWVTRSG